MEVIRRLVQADVGFGILSDLSHNMDDMASKNVSTVALIPGPPPFEVAIFKARNLRKTPAAVSFLGYILSRIL
ncbi:MAG: hypothetical protein COA78_00035 [Blastopirellula sp.]|nr:MAG: hypothetical protein COA78_00035 [Blastopirellula sp.]